jgi:hypothetical protein
MLFVWRDLDFDTIAGQALYICPNAVEALRLVQDSVMEKLSGRAGILKWAEWMFNMSEEFIQTVHLSDLSICAIYNNV